MHRYSYYKTAACTPNVSIGDPQANKEEILNCIQKLDSDTQLVVFPELCITGYTCQDLFYEHTLLNKAKQVLFEIVEELPENLVAVLGLPLEIDNKLYNCAARKDVINTHIIISLIHGTAIFIRYSYIHIKILIYRCNSTVFNIYA